MTEIPRILLLGMEGSGKSLFMKRLQQVATEGFDTNFKSIPSTVPTVGNNIINLTMSKGDYEFREIGGSMAPIWGKYLKDADALIYMIDFSNQFQISSSCIMLLTLLSNEDLSEKKVLLIFNKKDSTGTISLTELKKIYRLSDLSQYGNFSLKVVECSCVTKYGFDDVIEWLENVTVPQL
ncbi:ADP-ribosylation factor-like protein 16 [Hydractinia symbiolongicarpus]|uniref:ADP-ribosylation factor-like protein 16 n=1 Tax=Hydractinia symbiolongicarpus TaxID=13093 RepID=UPI00254CCB7F|nr:ADP-ribosylation factor-like protein 16 [Hydractinia symbiolongicarpus]